MIDASVCVKWYLTDEEMSDQAGALRDRFESGEIGAASPAHSRAEVASALASAAHVGRTSWERAHLDLANYIDTGLTRASDPDWLLHASLDAVRRLPISAYDALYLALADSLGALLVTADDRARRGLQNRIPNFVWLGDVPL